MSNVTTENNPKGVAIKIGNYMIQEYTNGSIDISKLRSSGKKFNVRVCIKGSYSFPVGTSSVKLENN